MTDPFRRLNDAHRQHVDTPWGRPARPHPVREEWRERRRPRRPIAPADPLLVQLGRYLLARPWFFLLPALLAFHYFFFRAIWRALSALPWA